MRLPSGLEPLRERSFRLFFAANTVSSFGGSMAYIALAFAVLRIGGPTDLGLVILAREVPALVLVLLGGVWSDRLPRHLVLVSSDLVRAAMQAGTAALFLTGHASIVGVAVLQFIYGGVEAFERPAYQGLVQQIVAGPQLQRANALIGLTGSTVRIAGPALGALIVAAAVPGWALAADAATFLVSAVLIGRLDLPRTLRLSGHSVLTDFREGWIEFVSRSWLVTVILSFGFFQLTFFPALLVLGPYVAKTQLGGPTAWGAVLAIESVGALVGGILALRVRFPRPLIANQLLVVPAGLEVLLLGLGAPLPAIMVVGFFSGCGFAIGGAVWFSTLQEKIPEKAMSRISSFDWFGSTVLNPIGYALIGPLSEAIGVGQALVVSGLLNVALAIGVLAIPSVRDLRAGPEIALADPELHDPTDQVRG